MKQNITAYLHLLAMLMLLLAPIPSTKCQLFKGLFADIDVGTARKMGFEFDGPGISRGWGRASIEASTADWGGGRGVTRGSNVEEPGAIQPV